MQQTRVVVRDRADAWHPVGQAFHHRRGGGTVLARRQSGALSTRVTVHTSTGERLGSGASVPGLQGVMIRADASPQLEGGGCWLQIRVPGGAGQVSVTPMRGDK